MAGLTAALEHAADLHAGAHFAARERLTGLLVGATLIESYHSFARHGKPYPFLSRRHLAPGGRISSTEHPFQRTALVFLVDEPIPVSLHKHIRLRRANEVSHANLRRLAPDIYAPEAAFAHLSVDAPGYAALFDELIEVDYGLVLQRLPGAMAPQLTHLHVKVERLTDNALRELARQLGYVRRRLNEKGEAYVERLEAKFFEYFGFAANASGRKSAAAMAAQLLAREGLDFTVFASCREDCRLTVLDESDTLEQHFLIALPRDRLEAAPRSVADYVIEEIAGESDDTRVVVPYCARFRRTAAARALRDGGVREEDVLGSPWLELVNEEIRPLPGRNGVPIRYDWSKDDEV